MSCNNKNQIEAKDNKSIALFGESLKVINVGLAVFYDSLFSQGAKVVHVAWRPPAGGDVKMANLLNKLL